MNKPRYIDLGNRVEPIIKDNAVGVLTSMIDSREDETITFIGSRQLRKLADYMDHLQENTNK